MKEYWFIDYDGGIIPFSRQKETATDKLMKSIGNYFSSREEAEKAVKKLKAWKRLRDKGFRVNGWTIPEEPKAPHIKLIIEAEMDVPDSPYDLDICFGGNE